jgi:FkbM family methyltransferase
VLELDISDPAQAQAYLIRRYQPDVVALLARAVPRGGVFFDVGANIGLISFSLGVRRPDISIFAFEPDPSNARRWRRNLELNRGLRAELEEVAVGAEEGEAELLQARESGWSFVAPPGSAESFKVSVATLDSYAHARLIAKIDALKIDVEGYEHFVFQGAASLLKSKAIRLIVCELEESLLARNGYTRTDVISLLSQYGYRARSVPPIAAQRLRRRSIDTSTDLVFVPE